MKKTAINFESRHLARTYIVVDEELTTAEEPAILAYFSVAINYLQINEKVDRAIQKKLNVLFRKADSERPIIPCYLIGQLAKNDKYVDNTKGSELIEMALSYIHPAHQSVGGCCIRVDCKDVDKLLDFYNKNGFNQLQKNKDGDL